MVSIKIKKIKIIKGPKLPEDTMKNIVAVRDLDWSWSQLSNLFGISRTTIRRVYDFMKGK